MEQKKVLWFSSFTAEVAEVDSYALFLGSLKILCSIVALREGSAA